MGISEYDEYEKKIIKIADKLHKQHQKSEDGINQRLDTIYGDRVLENKNQYEINPPKKVSELLETKFPELYCPYKGIIAEGSTILTGKPKAGKSAFMLGLAMRYTMGMDSLGVSTDGGGACFFGLEDGEPRLQRRIKAYLKAWNPTVAERELFMENMHYHIIVPRIDTGLNRYLSDYISDYCNVKLIVLDMFKKIDSEKPNRNVYKADARVGHEITRFCIENPGIAVIVTHHGRKVSSVNPVDAAIGTGGLVGSFDNVMHIEIEREERILHVVGRDIDPEEFTLESVNKEYTFNIIEQYQDSNRKKIWAAIPRTNGIKRNEIQDTLDILDRTLNYHLKQMEIDGLVFRPKYGQYQRTEKRFFEVDNT